VKPKRPPQKISPVKRAERFIRDAVEAELTRLINDARNPTYYNDIGIARLKDAASTAILALPEPYCRATFSMSGNETDDVQLHIKFDACYKDSGAS
jgi:hypothetical protein